MKKWSAVLILGCAQFVMVLDSTVMNVSISTVVADLDTTVAAMQSAITFYTLTMAAMMLLGAKLGDIWGRRRAFVIGAIVYAGGSLLTALSPNIVVLFLGWSVIEGLGAVLVIPAIAALVANNYTGRDRGTAFAVPDTTTPQRTAIDPWSVLLSAAGLVLIVLALLQAKTWGWVLPKQAPEIAGEPFEPLGLSVVPYLLALGGYLLWVFVERQRTLQTSGRVPLLTPQLFAIPQLRGGLSVLAAQYMVTAGLFFMIPIYLQMTLGFDALETGLKIFPLSIALIAFSAIGTRLSTIWSPRRIVRVGQLILIIGVGCLLGSVSFELRSGLFTLGMFLAGGALGLLASQLGNVNMSSVGEEQSSEVGGMQGVFQNLGSSLGTALIGSILIASLSASFLGAVTASDLPDSVKSEVSTSTAQGVAIVPIDSVDDIAEDAGLSPAEADELGALYTSSQVSSLRTSFFALMVMALLSLLFSKNIPTQKLAATPGKTAPERTRRSATSRVDE